MKRRERQMKYRVQCVRYGSVEVEADSESEAIDIAEGLPMSDYSWSDADDHQVVEEES